jgi:hypothetical protein
MGLLADTVMFAKGVGAVVAGVVIFFGSIYLLLAAVFGRLMGYLVTAVSFFGFMIIMSIIFVIGVPGSTPVNQGPRGVEPNWAPVAAGEEISSPRFPVVAEYPEGPWREPTGELTEEVEGVTGAIQEFLAERASEEVELQPGEEISPTKFIVQNVRFAEVDGAMLGAAQAFFSDGGPVVEVFAVFDEGNVPLPSWLFLGASILGFIAHLPFLDRAERKRKEILTGGTAPPWLGPA